MKFNLAHRIEDHSTMTPESAGYLIRQWSIWSDDLPEMKKLKPSRSKWQVDYRPSFDPDIIPEGREIEPGDDMTMERVDTAMRNLGSSNATHAHTLRVRYVIGYPLTHKQLEVPLRAFAFVYESLHWDKKLERWV